MITADHLARDDAAIEACAAGGGPSVRLWSPTDRCLVFPPLLRSRLQDAATLAYLEAAGWSAVARRTGGGMVPQGPGMLNVSMIFSAGIDAVSVEAGYHAVGDPIRRVLADLGVDTDFAAVPASFCDGRFNLSHRGRKLCGLSQWRGAARQGRPAVVLAHAVIIVEDDAQAALVLNGVQDIAGDEARFDSSSWMSVTEAAGDWAATALSDRLKAAFSI